MSAKRRQGTHKPAIEPRQLPIPGADGVGSSGGNMDRRVIASAGPTLRFRRPWHARTFLVREPGDRPLAVAVDRSVAGRRGAEADEYMR